MGTWIKYRSDAEQWLYGGSAEAPQPTRDLDTAPRAATLRATDLRDRIEAFYRVAKHNLTNGDSDSSAEFQSLAALFSAAHAHLDRMSALTLGTKT